MRSSAFTQWLNRRRTTSAPKARRAVLGVNPFEDRMVPASLAGNVFLDSNNNGVRDCGERGIAGVKVHLAGKTDCGQVVCKTAVTNCNGDYKFEGLRAGWYGVAECQPDGYKDGKDTVGSAGGHKAGKDAVACIRLDNCTTGTGYNFGERPECKTGHNGSDGKGSGGRGSNGKGSNDRCGSKGSDGRGSNGKGSGGKGSDGRGSNGKGSDDRCGTGSKGKGSGGKGSGGKGSNGKGSDDRCGTGSKGKGSGGKGSGGKGSRDRCDTKVKGNNGVGNGLDPQPPGNPRVNDGPGTSPGNPGNRGGK